MIRDARVLRAGFVLGKLSIATPKSTTFLASSSPSRTENQPTQLSSPDPAGRGRRASQIRHGTTSGRGPRRRAIYVNCWRNYTRFRTLYQILDDLGATIDIHRQSTPHDELVDRLQQHDGPRTVVILDEVDQLEDPSVIYDLHSLPQFALICIANKEEELFSPRRRPPREPAALQRTRPDGPSTTTSSCTTS